MICSTKIVLLYFIGIIVTINGATQRKGVAVEQLNEDNWDRMLTGEWMVEL